MDVDIAVKLASKFVMVTELALYTGVASLLFSRKCVP